MAPNTRFCLAAQALSPYRATIVAWGAEGPADGLWMSPVQIPALHERQQGAERAVIGHTGAMGRPGWVVVTVVIALTSTACRREGSLVELSASAPPTSTTAPAAPTTTTEPTTTIATTIAPVTTRASTRTTTSTTRVVATTARAPAPVATETTAPPVPREPVFPTPPSSMAAPSPLPIPELFDARQGLGTPCAAHEGRTRDGCFFFVYATTATRGRNHRLYSDAPFRTDYTLPGDPNQCGATSPHHPDRESCHWYIGPVQERAAGQRECFWMTTVEGTRESEPSNRVCFTWTDATT